MSTMSTLVEHEDADRVVVHRETRDGSVIHPREPLFEPASMGRRVTDGVWFMLIAVADLAIGLVVAFVLIWLFANVVPAGPGFT